MGARGAISRLTTNLHEDARVPAAARMGFRNEMFNKEGKWHMDRS